MGLRIHGVSARTRRMDVLVTVALCAAVFGVVLYLQAHLYAKCHDFVKLRSLEQLQAYIQTFAQESDSTDAAVDNLMTVAKELTNTITNSTQLSSKQREVTELQVRYAMYLCSCAGLDCRLCTPGACVFV